MNIIKTIKKKPIVFGVALIIIIIIIGLLIFNRNSSDQETMTIHRSDFISEVSASGKVVASQSAELGFDQSGRVAGIYLKVGDTVTTGSIIANIENASVRADIVQKQAVLEKEQANLASLQRGTRPEELAIYEQKYADASSALVIAMRNSYLKIEDSILSDVDTLFSNGNSVNPTINITTQSDSEKRAVESNRLILGEKLKSWRLALNVLPSKPSAEEIRKIRTIGSDATLLAKNLIDKLTVITGNMAPGNSGISQAYIDTYRSTVNTAGQQITTAASTEQDSYSAWSSADNSLLLEKSGSTSEDIAAQTAQVKSAEANLISARAQLSKTLITAPFDGVITKIDLKIGEIASPNTSEISVMSAGTFEVESYIPEINIARIKLNNPAIITLDAYGSNIIFPASIISIDPAETLRDGVSTYKIRLRFSENDPRIKSGMTANIRITSENKPNAIVIPQSVITERDGKKFVQVKTNSVIGDVEITTGSSTGLGQIEIVSGLDEGDIIIVPPLTQNP